MSKYNANLNQDAGSIHTPARYDDNLDKWIMDVGGEELLSMKASLEDLVTKLSNTLTVDDTESRAELEAMKVKLEAIEIKLNEQTYEDGAALTKLTGSYVRLVGESLPTVADGVEDGNTLLVIDEANDDTQAYIWRNGAWRSI